MRYGAVFLLVALSTQAAAQEPTQIVSSGPASYTLRPGDVVQITVWGREEYSGRFQVNERGQIQYPLIGEIDTRDITLAELRERVKSGLERIFNQPFVTITPFFRMAVIGEVRSPGLYTVDPTLSVLEVVALAGGGNPDANLNSVRLFRGGEEMRVRFDRDGLGGQTLQEIGIRSGDQIIVPRKSWTQGDWLFLLQFAQVAISVAILIKTF